MLFHLHKLTQFAFFSLFMLKDARAVANEVKTLKVQLDQEFVAGLWLETNLCKIVEPPVDRIGSFWIGMNRIPETTSSKVRFMVVHQCRRSTPQGLFKNFLQRAFECEDTRFVQALQNCHEDILFMWSNQTSEAERNEKLPENIGIPIDQNAFLMMMVIFENVQEPFNDNSGLELLYRQQSASHPIRQAKRLVIGHQANGKHVLLSGLQSWTSDSYCSSQCLSQKKNSPAIDVVALEVHTRALGTSVQIDVRYKTGKIEAEIGEKLSLEDLAEEDKEETGNKTATSLPPSPSTSNKFSFPETFFPASGFLFPSSLSPPPPFLLPRSSGSFGGREFFFDTPMLPKTELEMDQVQTIRKVLDPFYRILTQDDDILLRCRYSTSNLKLPTFGGISHDRELCFAILTYVENVEINRNDKFTKTGFSGKEVTSCMSHPTDRNLAVALQFNLDRYETENYPKPLRLRRTKRNTRNFIDNERQRKYGRRFKRQSRQSTKSGNIDSDVFLSQPVTSFVNDLKITTVLQSIDKFDRLNNVDQRISANFDILNGAHVSACSNQEEGVFLSVLIDNNNNNNNNNTNVNRENLTYTPRNFNFASHNRFISTRNGGTKFENFYAIYLLILMNVLWVLHAVFGK